MHNAIQRGAGDDYEEGREVIITRVSGRPELIMIHEINDLLQGGSGGITERDSKVIIWDTGCWG